MDSSAVKIRLSPLRWTTILQLSFIFVLWNPQISYARLKCTDLFSAPYEVITFNSERPKKHIGLEYYGRPQKIEVALSAADIKVGNYFRPAVGAEDLTIDRISPNKRYFRTEGEVRPRYFEVIKTDPGVIIKEVSSVQADLEQSPQISIESKIKLSNRFDPNSMDGSRALAASQSEASKTLEGKNSDNEKEFLALIAANQVMIRVLQQRGTLSFKTISLINQEIAQATDNKEKSIVAGSIRGLPAKVIKFENKFYTVDLTKTEMTGGWGVYYLPAKLVPFRLENWIKKANGINNSSSLTEIIELYQEFIVIHPFVEGNGRTARVLMDAMLIKAGFPPMPHVKELTRSVLRISIPDLYGLFIKAYSRGGF